MRALMSACMRSALVGRLLDRTITNAHAVVKNIRKERDA